MKKQIIISTIIGIFFISNINFLSAQQTRRDTLSYLQQIVANKADYIGKPFSVLKRDLKLKIIHFNSLGKEGHKSEATAITFRFITPKRDEDFSYPKLIIFWKSPYIDISKSDELYLKDKKNLGAWNKEVESLFGSCIIEDIQAR